jgi:predicted secreted protein
MPTMRMLGSALIGLAALLVTAPAMAADTPAAPGPDITVVHLTARAEQLLPRDRLEASLAVEVTGATPQQVQAEINKRMEAALTRVRAVAAVKPQTGGYNVYQQHEPNKPAAWHGSQSLTLSSDAPAALLDLVGALQQQGLVTSGLAYQLSPETQRKAEDALTAEALGDLRRRADRIAADLGMSVQQLRDVVVGNAQTEGRPPIAMRMMLGKADAPTPPAAEPGDATVSVTVEATVWLARKP